MIFLGSFGPAAMFGGTIPAPGRVSADSTHLNVDFDAAQDYTVTVPAGTKRLVVLVTLGRNATSSFGAATYNAAAMTLHTSGIPSGGYAHSAIYSLINPSTGANTLVVNIGGSGVDTMQVRCVFLNNAGTVLDASSDSSASTTSTTVSLNATDCIVLGCVCTGRISASAVAHSGLTELDDTTQSAGGGTYGYSRASADSLTGPISWVATLTTTASPIQAAASAIAISGA